MSRAHRWMSSIAVVVALGWFGFDTPAASARAASRCSGKVRIATFNINFGNVNLPDIVRVIRASSADIVLLQETNAQSRRFLRRRLGADYPHMKFRGPGRHYLAAGFGILSRCRIERSRFLRPKHGLFGTWLVTARIDGRAVQLVNAHLAPPDYRAAMSGPVALMREVTRVERTHKKEMAQILGALANKGPTVFAGDLNSLSTHHASTTLRSRGFIDSFANAVSKPDAVWTWQLPGRKGIGFRIDYLFHTKQLQTVSSRVIQSRGSDHHLVVSEIRVRPAHPRRR